MTIIIRTVFEEGGKLYPQVFLDDCLYELKKMQANIRQIKIKNHPDYLFNDNMIVNIKDFDFSILEINKLSFKGVFGLNICYIKYTSTKSPNRVSIDRTDNDEDYLLFVS